MYYHYTLKKAVELLDAPSKIIALMLNKSNSSVEIHFFFSHVLFFTLLANMKVRN